MGSRERKRAERRKRKRRTAERASPGGAAEAEGGDGAPQESFQERLSRHTEERNAEARAELEPLTEGERPTAVTVGAAISALIAVIFTASAVVAAVTSVEVSGEEPNPVPLGAFAVMLWMMALGMWRARYWAVLGFQMMLVLLILATAAGLGTLFYFLIRAMARIQMPERPQGR